MNCLNPKRIHHKYTGQWMYVPCRVCPACKINMANKKTFDLSQDMKMYKRHYLLTLDYDNYSVPFVIKGFNKILRYAEYVRKQGSVDWVHSDFPVIVDDLSEDEVEAINKINKPRYLRRHFVSDAIGVLYYKDLQNFFKRLRQELKKYGIIEFRKFACGEYGPRTGRSHFHVSIYSNDERLTLRVLQAVLPKTWPFKSWTRFQIHLDEEAIKRCDPKTAQYIASYVNSCSRDFGISSIKRFRQKTIRSKNINFGIMDESRKIIKDFINGRLDEDIRKRGSEVFEIIDCSRIDRIQPVPISSRYFSAFFPKFKGYAGTTSSTFKARARLIYLQFNSGFKQELIDNEVLSSQDLVFMRGFSHFKQLYEIECEDDVLFDIYLERHDLASRLYKSLCLKNEMKLFEELGDDYFLLKINTYAENLEKRHRKICTKLHRFVFSSDIDKPPFITRKLSLKCDKYKYKLLPKHFNDFNFL